VRRLILLISVVVLVTMLANVPMSVTSDSSVSFTDINTPDNDITARQTQAINFWASAMITTTMSIMPNE
jgi:hypothetical protein